MPEPDDDLLELFPEPVFHPKGPLLNGTVARLEAGYAREVKVGTPVLAAVLTTAGVARAIGAFAISLLPGGTTPGSVWRNWKTLRKGPEYLVTPMHLRDSRDGRLCEVEFHGYLPATALQRGDLLRLRIKPQRDRQLPPRVERLSNLTTGQVLRPAPPNLRSHLGPALILQAVAGIAVLATVIACGFAVLF